MRRTGLLVAVSSVAAIGAASTAQAAVLISSGATTNMACVGGVCTPTKKSAILNVTQLESLLASGNVKVTTAGATSSDILVNAKIVWASGNGLTLDAYHSITVDRAISVNGTGALSIVTDDGGTGGILSFGEKGRVGFLSTANSLTINGAAYTLVADTTTLTSDIAAAPSGDFALASNYNATGNSSFVLTTFTGSFEGLGNTITDLTLTASNAAFGLFAQVGAGGSITDVRLTKFAISGGYEAVGALVGWNEGYLAGDSSSGKLLGVSQQSGGGLVGINQGTIFNCYSSAKISTDDRRSSVFLGGLVGDNVAGGTVGASYATGSISSKGEEDNDGGLAGDNEGLISNSYATVSVAGSFVVGGLVGGNSFEAGTSRGIISNSYSTGAVTGGSGSKIGGLIGFDALTGGVTAAYWDTTTSGITNLSQGAGNVSNDPGITGLSNTQLQAGLPGGFSSTIWGENPSINGRLPYLLALPPPARVASASHTAGVDRGTGWVVGCEGTFHERK